MKMKTTKIILLAMLISLGLNTMAQVAINTDGSAPDESAILDVESTTKGMLMPRMSQTQIMYIENPANGLTVFNTDANRFYFYDGTTGKWKEIAIASGTITPWTCGDALEDNRDSKSYTTVEIGTQCWMAENLNIGIRIDEVDDQTDNSKIEKYCYDDDDANCTIYGGLYQWDEMMQYTITAGDQGICPIGWHLPTDVEWMTLEEEVESTSGVDWNTIGLRGTDAGGNLKETGTTHWNSPNSATNSSGFTALPGGICSSSGSFWYLGRSGHWWSSSWYSGVDAWNRVLNYSTDQVNRIYNYQMNGYSVRCLKD